MFHRRTAVCESVFDFSPYHFWNRAKVSIRSWIGELDEGGCIAFDGGSYRKKGAVLGGNGRTGARGQRSGKNRGAARAPSLHSRAPPPQEATKRVTYPGRPTAAGV